MFHNGSSSRRGGRIHLVVQDYETSARLVQATQRGRSKQSLVDSRVTMTTNQHQNNEYDTTTGGDDSNNNDNVSSLNNDRFRQRSARSDRNFIGSKPKEAAPNKAVVLCGNDNYDGGTGDNREKETQQEQQSESMGLLTKNYAAAQEKETQQQQQQSESMGLLSKNYAAALLGVTAIDEKTTEDLPHGGIVQQHQQHQQQD